MVICYCHKSNTVLQKHDKNKKLREAARCFVSHFIKYSTSLKVIAILNDDTFSRFDRIPACDGQTDGQSDRQTDGYLATA